MNKLPRNSHHRTPGLLALALLALLVGQAACAEDLPEMEVDSTIYHLRVNFDAETRDDAWAVSAEERLREAFATAKLEVVELSCQTTVCRAIVAGVDHDIYDERVMPLLDTFERLDEIGNERAEHIHRAEKLGEFYFSRDGFHLNGEPIVQ